MAELFGKADRLRGGRGGSMHLVDIGRHFLGSNGIVGAGLGLAMGAALAHEVALAPGLVAVGFFGDGGANTGRVWEFINLAASVEAAAHRRMREQPLCRRDAYLASSWRVTSVPARASGFGLPAEAIDGQDVLAVYHAVCRARSAPWRARDRPSSRRCTYRYEGHNVGDVQNYREKSRSGRLARNRATPSTGSGGSWPGEENWMMPSLDGSRRRARRPAVADAIAFAEASPWPDPASVDRAWPNPDLASSAPVAVPAVSERLTYTQAYRAGLAEEMTANDLIFVMGTDILLRGGHFAQVLGLGEQFGAERIRDAPISEAAMVAAGVGAALSGMRPVVDLNFLDFAFGGMDELCNQAAKIHYMFGIPVPLVIRATNGSPSAEPSTTT